MTPGRLTFATLLVTGPRASGRDAGGGHPHPPGGGSGAGHGRNETYFLRYGVNRRADVGLGYWSEPGKLRPAVNWQAAREHGDRPGVLVGYGSEPMGEWRHDGAYVSLIKGFGSGERRLQTFAAYFREIDGGTHHLIGGVSQPLGKEWALFVGRYPFNAWHAAATYQLPSGAQVGLWAHDFGRKPRLGVSLGVGWQVAGRAGNRTITPPDRPLPDDAKRPQPEETAPATGAAAARESSIVEAADAPPAPQ